ncbi:hypothetical protein G6F46_010904 [Rhizopus delemar]|uniref:RGS domain-containing protein n=2 Tax=Rhizopus TaxID=4842 RepID=A0A9P6YSP7_9FUNG|nr:hypothetical protein G6F55_010205 [Rhizopus delemar]KAG1536428.1 hypothetical protein G6F51_010976 [Rhizopus arrhizus]KAG1495517.1 hypothetical protein G6F54_007113 [Rhizopus delemar]KAG1499233.1 hypothetical protein G6F53_011562 [Rhizopus delemar]KAG1514603.1 hypothetical protein G6F52_009882 [Rhizopus delemar]
MMTQITLASHRHMFRSYVGTFSSEEAIAQLGSLKFSKRDECANAASFITTTFNMNKGMAKALIQQFLWSRLIENAVEPQNRTYREKGIWRIRSKGLCVLQNFCKRTKTDISMFKKHVGSMAVPMYLINMERMPHNDRINRSRKFMSCLFTIMIASLPLSENASEKQNDLYNAFPELGKQDILNSSRDSSIYSNDYSSIDTNANLMDCNLKITDFFPQISILPNNLLIDVDEKSGISFQQQQSLMSNLNPTSSSKFKMRAIFPSSLCCNWLVEYCTVSSTDEAEITMSEFLKFGWITFLDEKYRYSQQVESSKSNILKLTNAGKKVVIDICLNQHNLMKVSMSDSCSSRRSSLVSSSCSTIVSTNSESSLPQFGKNDRSSESSVQALLLSDTSTIDYFSTPTTSKILSNGLTPPLTPTSPSSESKESNLFKLKAILQNPQFRSLYRDFLCLSFCQENLDFCIDFDNLRRRCNNLVMLPSANQRQLLEDAYMLWDSYLRPGAAYELNIEHNLREEMAEEISHIVTVSYTSGQNKPNIVVLSQSTYQSLLIILKWFDNVKEQICKLMSCDSIPKFVKTPKYKEATSNLQIFCVSPALNNNTLYAPRQHTK